MRLAVAPLDARTRAFDSTIAGVLGADLLARAGAIDLTLSPCSISLKSSPAKRGRGTIRETDGGGGGSFPITWIEGRPTLAAAVSDGVMSRAARFALATAQAPATIDQARLSRPGADSRGRIRALSFAGRLFERARAAPGQPDALGTEILSRFRLRLSATRLQVGPAAK